MNNQLDKFYNMIGMGKRANLVRVGDYVCTESIQKNTSSLIIVAEDASQNTRKKFTQKCEFYQVKCIVIGEKTNLGNAVGKEAAATLTVNDEKFAAQLIKIIENIT